ncbi:hypothetical protein PM082_002353 [Marasmius tenuissimus]|nr:hypothetical protein PM082_002353 [Marasmius tenuissimus]
MGQLKDGSDNLAEAFEPFLTVQQVIVLPIATLSCMFLVYGMYTIVFGLCMHVLCRRQSSSSRLYSVCTVCLFALGSIFVASEVYGCTRQAIIDFRAAKTQDFGPLEKYMDVDVGVTVWECLSNFSATLMNVFADVMLIHRCYILWGSSKILLYIVGGAAFVLNGISITTPIMGAVGLTDPRMVQVYVTAKRIDNGNTTAIAVFNALLTLLTAGKIWWITREARRNMGMSIHSVQYKAIVAAIIESGVLYPTSLITSIMVRLIIDPDAHGTLPVDLAAVSTMMAGFAPTLVIVRVAYGKSVDSVQQMMSIHFAEQTSRPGHGHGVSTLRTTVNLPSRSQDEDHIEQAKSEFSMNGDRIV